MTDTFPIRSKLRGKGAPPGSDDAEDDLSSVFFITKRSSVEKRSRDVKVIDAGPGPNFLEILIFAASVCLWITSVILLCCHIVMLTARTNSYSYMIHHPKMMAFIILQIASTAVEFCAAICATFCVSYDVEAHNVIGVAKLAIGFVCCNIGMFICVLVVGSFVKDGLQKKHFNDRSCSKACGRGLEIITHLFFGCSYEGIAINLCTIPVLVWVLKEAIVFVKLDLEARNEKATVTGSASTTDLLHKGKFDSKRKVRFSRSTSSMIESIIPEVAIFKKLPDTNVRNETNDMRDAVIRMMSEDWSSPVTSSPAPPVTNVPAGSKRPSGGSFQKGRKEKSSAADSASSVDPWSTTSPSTSDDAKDF